MLTETFTEFESRLYEYFIGIIQDDLGLDLSSHQASGLVFNEYNFLTGRVHKKVEEIRKHLRDTLPTKVIMLNLFYRNGRIYDFITELTREDFENICQPVNIDVIIARAVSESEFE